MNIDYVGNGEVHLISGGGKVFTDIAARFCRSTRDLNDIIASPYDAKIVKNILSSNHLAATEFDYFIFGIQGYSRVTEVQLVRKRIASYLISSGRVEHNRRRSFDVIVPSSITNPLITGWVDGIECDNIWVYTDPDIPDLNKRRLSDVLPNADQYLCKIELTATDILTLIENWYDEALINNVPEEEARYLKPQATEFKAIIGMNAHSLIDWFKIRCCMNAQTEIRDLANKMLKLCKEVAPDLFANAGASCVSLGYCPENGRQNKKCNKLTHEAVKRLILEVGCKK